MRFSQIARSYGRNILAISSLTGESNAHHHYRLINWAWKKQIKVFLTVVMVLSRTSLSNILFYLSVHSSVCQNRLKNIFHNYCIPSLIHYVVILNLPGAIKATVELLASLATTCSGEVESTFFEMSPRCFRLHVPWYKLVQTIKLSCFLSKRITLTWASVRTRSATQFGSSLPKEIKWRWNS